MRTGMLVWVVSFSFALAGPSGTQATAGDPPAEARRPTGISVWDTGTASAAPLPAGDLSGKNDWSLLAPGKPVDTFKGDAVLSNGRIAVVLRQQDSAVE